MVTAHRRTLPFWLSLAWVLTGTLLAGGGAAFGAIGSWYVWHDTFVPPLVVIACIGAAILAALPGVLLLCVWLLVSRDDR